MSNVKFISKVLCQKPNVQCQISKAKLISNVKCQMSHVTCQISNNKGQMTNVKCQVKLVDLVRSWSTDPMRSQKIL